MDVITILNTIRANSSAVYQDRVPSATRSNIAEIGTSVLAYESLTKEQFDNMTVAGKTGTTDAYNDLWFVGYTPYYTCAVWSGYDNNEKLHPRTPKSF